MIETAERHRGGGVVRHPDLLGLVTDLLHDVEEARFPLDLPGAEEHRELRERLATKLSAQLLPRLRQAAAPAVVVVGGSTGAGKSTLVNALVGREVSPAGVRRPTTRRPVLVVHPREEAAFAGHPVTALAEVVPDDGVPPGLALLDAPDLDSVDAANRNLAEQLLHTADLWVFVTTATRYGDALPWSLLRSAQDRGLATAVLLNRVRAEVLRPVRADLAQRLDTLGLGSAPLFVIPDAGPHSGALPDGWFREVTDWFTLVATRHQAPGIVHRTLRGGWPGLRDEVRQLADGVSAQVEQADRLRATAAAAVAPVAQRLAVTLENGAAAEGAPTVRWRALASAGGPLELGPRARRGWRGRRTQTRDEAAQRLAQDTRASLTTLMTAAFEEAAAAVRAAWRSELPGAVLPAPDADPGAPVRVVEAWARVVRDRAGRLDSRALGTDGVAGLLLAGAAGVTGAADTVGRLLGPATVRELREDLVAAAAGEVERVARRYARTVDELGLRPGTAAGLRLRAAELGQGLEGQQ